VLFRMMPGSPERQTKNPHLTPEFVAAERAKWGLDKPLFPDQLIAFVASTAQGDLGYSIKYRGQPVVEVVADAAVADDPASSGSAKPSPSSWGCGSGRDPAGDAAARSTGSGTRSA
jgi:hypothetical protein